MNVDVDSCPRCGTLASAEPLNAVKALPSPSLDEIKGLKPCPFCGKDTLKVVKIEDWFWVACDNPSCHITGSADLGESGAFESWNTRPIEDALRAEIERLREALEWYAKPRRYRDAISEALNDMGYRARKVLEPQP